MINFSKDTYTDAPLAGTGMEKVSKKVTWIPAFLEYVPKHTLYEAKSCMGKPSQKISYLISSLR